MSNFIKEACVENLFQVQKAQENGADRIELCANLELDGLTPDKKLITEVNQLENLDIRVMIRPRAGDFVYSDEEISRMIDSIEFCKAVGVEGVVFGILNSDNSLNLKHIARLAEIAQPLKVVIHKAIDVTPAPLEAVRQLLQVSGVTSVLTSGGAQTAFEGKEVLKEMLRISQDRLEIVPAGKITDDNVNDLHHFLGAKSYHGKRIVGSLA